MEPPKSDAPKLPDMVMCGDHPSFTKTELNVKTDVKMDEKDKEKAKDKTMSYAKITPTPSRTERSDRPERAERAERTERVERAERPERTERTERTERAERSEASVERRARATSEHALQLSAARRRVRSLEVVQRPDVDVAATGNRALVQVFPAAALGSFRWPPYLLCVWVVVLVLTHMLHCLVSLLERALPALRKCSQFFRTWTEETWRGETETNQRVYPVALAGVTALLYALYYTLYAGYAVVLWSIEPLCSDVDEKRSLIDIEANVTNYEDDIKTNSCIKP